MGKFLRNLFVYIKVLRSIGMFYNIGLWLSLGFVDSLWMKLMKLNVIEIWNLISGEVIF